MNIFRTFFELFIFYMLYKLVFEFIIPIFKASKHMKNQVGQMQQQMKEQQRQQGTQNDNFANVKKPSGASRKDPGKDYIEFEELK
jgi:hypothetical protein